MSTGIEWTDGTWNPLAAFDRETGERGWFCTKVSPGCKHCYAEALNKRLGTGHDYAVPNLEEIEFRLVNIERPVQWQESGKHVRVFVNSMTDLFHEAVPDEMLDRMFAAMALAPDITFQILTKRPGPAAEYLNGRDWCETANKLHDEHIEPLSRPMYLAGEIVAPLPNVWLGTSVEDQQRANERIPKLEMAPAAVRFLSCEPLLGPIDFWEAGSLGPEMGDPFSFSALSGPEDTDPSIPGLDWVIVGGESGPEARPMELEWAAQIVEQCRRAGVPVFVKQLGSVWAGGARKKGGDPSGWPEALRVREFPFRDTAS